MKIRKMQTAAGGPLNLSPKDIKKGANLIGEYFLKGLGTFGKIMTAPFVQQGPTSATIYKSKELLAKERTIENKSEELLGKAMTWVSPLNYVAALATGNGLNARKGEEEVTSWSPAWQAVGRLGELYAGPKAVKGVKATPRVVVNTAAKAGVKPAKAAVVAREINRTTKLGVQNINLRPKILNYDLLANNYGFPKSFKLVGAESEQRAFLGDDGYVYKIPKYGASDGTFVTKNMSINRLPNDLGAKTEFLGMRKNPDGTKTPIIRLEYVDPIKSRQLYLDLMKNYNYNNEFHFILFDDKGLHVVEDIRPSNVGTINGKLKIFDIGAYETPKNIQKPVTKTIKQEPSTSLKFFERKPSKLDWSLKVGLPKEVRNRKVPQYTLENARLEALLFAKKWGYELPENASLLLIEELYNLHNTLFRGVTTEGLNNTRETIAKNLGIKPELLTTLQYLEYVSTHSWPGNDRIWVTPNLNYAGLYGVGNRSLNGMQGLVSAVMRPWKKTKDIKKWPQQAEWKLGFKEDILDPVITPWVSNDPNAIRSTGALSELLIKGPLIYRGLGLNFKGTLLLQLKYNDGQGKLGWIESLVGELPLEIIIEKQGGKMNVLEFLKNGSGIHIKEKNKGKFTSYCGGKVTDECILKGKNSSNPAIRKRATFAANARKWKHEKGGELIKKALWGDLLPTAEKAEDRYKNGEFFKEFYDGLVGPYNIGHTVVEGVRTNKPFHNLGFIQRKIRYVMGVPSDTTFTEIPPSFLPVKKAARVATRYSGWKDNAYAGNLKDLYNTLKNRWEKANLVMSRKEGGILKAQLGVGLTLVNDSENPNAVGGDIVNSYIRNQLMIPYLLALKEGYEKWKLQMKLQANTLKSSLFDNLLNTGLSIGTDYLKSKLGIGTEKAGSN